ncbi:hypothetical protein DBP19_14925 [Streptomyces sp. CS090A]|nr:hypothetical protein DBP19_14925 [Streptomyces sp. CS090A]
MTGGEAVAPESGGGGVVGRGSVVRGERGGPGLLPVGTARRALRSAVRAVYEGPFAAPEGAAVLHPNGFAKLPVAVVPDTGRRLYLHVWLSDGEDSHVHNHRWDFSSIVLTGQLDNTMMEVGPGGEGPRYRALRHRPCAGGFRFDGGAAPEVGITALRTVVLPERSAYTMDALTLHRVRAGRGTMTLVARGMPSRAYSDVLLDGPVEDGERRMRTIGSSERMRYLRRALEALG